MSGKPDAPGVTVDAALDEFDKIVRLHQEGELSDSIVEASKVLEAAREAVRAAAARERSQAREKALEDAIVACVTATPEDRFDARDIRVVNICVQAIRALGKVADAD